MAVPRSQGPGTEESSSQKRPGAGVWGRRGKSPLHTLILLECVSPAPTPASREAAVTAPAHGRPGLGARHQAPGFCLLRAAFGRWRHLGSEPESGQSLPVCFCLSDKYKEINVLRAIPRDGKAGKRRRSLTWNPTHPLTVRVRLGGRRGFLWAVCEALYRESVPLPAGDGAGPDSLEGVRARCRTGDLQRDAGVLPVAA